MLQMMTAVAALHETWIVHRDLKTTNLLVNYRGILKVCDFGMARHCGSPYRAYTEEVISRWYRPPEILIGSPSYSTGVDVWSIGCIFGELLQRSVAIPGDSELDQVEKIFTLCGTPTAETWPAYSALAIKKGLKFAARPSTLRVRFPKQGYDPQYVHGEQCKTTSLSPEGADLLELLLTCNPDKRISAADALDHPYFEVSPPPEPLTPEHLAQLKRDRGDAIAQAKKVAEAKAQAQKLASLGLNPMLNQQRAQMGMGGFSMGLAGVNPMAGMMIPGVNMGLWQRPPGT